MIMTMTEQRQAQIMAIAADRMHIAAILQRRRDRFEKIRIAALARNAGKGDIEALAARLQRDLLDECLKEIGDLPAFPKEIGDGQA